MTDHIARVREQAERASREAYDFNGVRGHDSRNGTRRKAFIAGAVWAASRVTPTREQIVEVLREHQHDYCEECRNSYGCTCGWNHADGTLDVHDDDPIASVSDHQAGVVATLLAGLAEGES